jgi:hypothetical protein
MAIQRVKGGVAPAPYGVWSHSISMAYLHGLTQLEDGTLRRVLGRIPGSAVAVVAIAPLLLWVHHEVFRARSRAVTYPLFLFTVSLASFVPEIANDYSLFFLPLAAASVVGTGDCLTARAALALSLVAIQPFLLPIPGLVLLPLKFCAVFGVGASLVGRARNAAQPAPASGGVSGTFASPEKNQ